MNLLYYTARLKNFIKTNFGDNNKIYSSVRALYLKLVFPLERSMVKNKASKGFESKTALHMCSLLPRKTIDATIKRYRPKTWLDVGCGIGSSLKYVKKRGIEIMGLENSALAIKISKLGTQIKKFDLTLPVNLGHKFDVVWCYEVAEHLPEEFADIFVDTLVRHGDNIVLSAATPGQGGDGHVNEQPASYWIEKMNDRGYRIDKEVTEEIQSLNELYSRNVHCFRKNTSLPVN